MPTEILGLPLHPLAVHLPVVFVPLLALCTAGYVLIPRIRQQSGWVLIALTIVTPPTAFLAQWSGRRLAESRLAEVGPDFAQPLAEGFAEHSQYGDVLVWLVLAMAPLTWLFSGLVSGRPAGFARRRSWRGLAAWSDAAATRRILRPTLSVLLLVLAVASLVYVALAGHSGAELHWGG